MQFGPYGKNVGWYPTGFVAVIYGLGVAFLGSTASEATAQAWTWWGSLIVGVLFLAFMVVPFFLWLFGARRPDRDKLQV